MSSAVIHPIDARPKPKGDKEIIILLFPPPAAGHEFEAELVKCLVHSNAQTVCKMICEAC